MDNDILRYKGSTVRAFMQFFHTTFFSLQFKRSKLTEMESYIKINPVEPQYLTHYDFHILLPSEFIMASRNVRDNQFLIGWLTYRMLGPSGPVPVTLDGSSLGP